MDFELQRRMDGAVHKCLGEQRNTVIEIQKMYSTPLIARSRKSRKFVAATVTNGSQASKVQQGTLAGGPRQRVWHKNP
jgi:hypothetical protein